MDEDQVDAAMDVISKALKDELGPSCDEFEVGCITCAAWRAYSDLSLVLWMIEKWGRS